MTIAEVHVSHPDLVLVATVRAASDARFERRDPPVAVADGSFVAFFAVASAFDDVDRALDADPTVADPQVVADYGDRRVYRVRVTGDAKLVSPTLAGLSIQLLDVTTDAEGVTLRLLIPGREALVAFREFCDAESMGFAVRAMYPNEDAETQHGLGLTENQRAVLQTARERGYFDDPRKTSLQELADEAGISTSGIGRRLRRAVGTLIDAMLDPED